MYPKFVETFKEYPKSRFEFISSDQFFDFRSRNVVHRFGNVPTRFVIRTKFVLVFRGLFNRHPNLPSAFS